MKAGTKTVLFGTHHFLIHPIFVFFAWLIYYRSFPKSYELFAILTHDWGLWGLPNIDGEEGEEHPKIMADIWLYGFPKYMFTHKFREKVANEILGHSQFYSKKSGVGLSKLFYPDKLSVSLYPISLYMIMGILSGEINEYMKISNTEGSKYDFKRQKTYKLNWFLETRAFMALRAFGSFHILNIKKDQQ